MIYWSQECSINSTPTHSHTPTHNSCTKQCVHAYFCPWVRVTFLATGSEPFSCRCLRLRSLLPPSFTAKRERAKKRSGERCDGRKEDEKECILSLSLFFRQCKREQREEFISHSQTRATHPSRDSHSHTLTHTPSVLTEKLRTAIFNSMREVESDMQSVQKWINVQAEAHYGGMWIILRVSLTLTLSVEADGDASHWLSCLSRVRSSFWSDALTILQNVTIQQDQTVLFCRLWGGRMINYQSVWP